MSTIGHLILVYFSINLKVYIYIYFKEWCDVLIGFYSGKG